MSDLAALDAELEALGLSPERLVERFIRASGPGGQKVNKTASAVFLKDPQSGFEVKAQGERSQLMNRIEARRLLIERVKAERARAARQRKDAREKARRRARQPSKAAKRRNVEQKRRRGSVKRTRGRVKGDE